MDICENLINYGIILRYLLTIIFFIYLFLSIFNNYIKNNYIKKYIYLILPISLTLLDFKDNIPKIFYDFFLNKKK